LSTLTDLFNIKLGLNKKAIFIEEISNNYTVFYLDEKIPVREKIEIIKYNNESIEDILDEKNVVKENIYYIILPTKYFRNTINLPFKERQKVDAVIKYEVRDHLPNPDFEYLTDFYNFKHQTLSFSIKKDEIRDVLLKLGRYRENLRAVLPFDIVFYFGILRLVDRDNLIFIDVQNDITYVSLISERELKKGIYIKKIDNEQFTNTLKSELIMLSRIVDYPTIYVNVRDNVKRDFHELNLDILKSLGVSYRSVPSDNFKKVLYTDIDKDIVPSDLISVVGSLEIINQPSSKRVNLLKEEFKPRIKGYVTLKDFFTIGIFLVLIILISITNIFMETGFKKKKLEELKDAMNRISIMAFEKPSVNLNEAKNYLKDIKSRIKVFENSINRKYSATYLLKELALSIPGNVTIEYTDIIIDKNHIKLAGKTRTFSDIDRMKEAFSQSGFFTNVNVSNTGTTGSSEGFAVTFLFDIDVVFK